MGAGGFIGGHLVNRLIQEGYRVVAVDIKEYPDWFQINNYAVNECVTDLREKSQVDRLIQLYGFDEIYQLAADMGGAGYVFVGTHDADIVHSSAVINLNVARALADYSRRTKVFYSSSACVYPKHNQLDPDNPNLEETSAWPADPDSPYGLEKLFSEEMWMAFSRNYKLDVKIARLHNVFGPYGSWDDDKEKAPAAICRKVIQAEWDTIDGLEVEVWGPGNQTRSFLYIDECLEGMLLLMKSSVTEVINLGSEEMISINDLTRMVAGFRGEKVRIRNIDGPVGVAGRNSDNRLIKEVLGWAPSQLLIVGMKKTYDWIETQVKEKSLKG